MIYRTVFPYLLLFSPSIVLATGNTTDVITLMMLFFSVIVAALQATVVGILLSMTLFKHQWLVIVSFIISGLNLLLYLASISSWAQFGKADLIVWLIIAVAVVASPSFIIMTLIAPTKQYKKMQRSRDEL